MAAEASETAAVELQAWVRLAVRLALQRTTMASMSGAIRDGIQWRDVEVAILRRRAPRRS